MLSETATLEFHQNTKNEALMVRHHHQKLSS